VLLFPVVSRSISWFVGQALTHILTFCFKDFARLSIPSSLTPWRKNPKVHHRTNNIPPQVPVLRQFFVTNIEFYGGGLLVPCPTPELEYHPLSAVRDCLFNIFAATLHIRMPSPLSATRGRAMQRSVDLINMGVPSSSELIFPSPLRSSCSTVSVRFIIVKYLWKSIFDYS
jgi:hypothetical protein